MKLNFAQIVGNDLLNRVENMDTCAKSLKLPETNTSNRRSNKTVYKQVKYGHIIETTENGKAKRVFSCCNTDFTQLTMWLLPDYCPRCGAKIVE